MGYCQLATVPQVMVGDRLPWGGHDKGRQGCVPSFLVNRFLRLQALAPLCEDWVLADQLHHLLHKTAHLRRWHSDYVQKLQNFMPQPHFQNYTAYVHGGRSWSGPDPKGGGGTPPPSTDPKIVARNKVLCRRQRRRRFCFRHTAGGIFLVPPYVSILKILRILWAQECRGYVAIPPSVGPPRRQG